LETEVTAARTVLHHFGEASSRVTNLAKSAIALIRCENLDLNEITLAFPCQVADFPCKYLGLPLSPADSCYHGWLEKAGTLRLGQGFS
jgi:hypothetical protein